MIQELIDMLSDNLVAWEGEEDSVKEEPTELIADLTRALLERTT